MVSNTLDELGRSVLEAIAGRRASVGEVELGVSRAELDERLDQLVENGLVRQTGEGYELLENGRRVLVATPAGALDERIDTPAHVENRLAGFDLRADEEAAVRGAFTLLRYWGDATSAELVDGIYSEDPAGYDSASTWWAFVHERLAALPDVRVSSDGLVEWWSYSCDAVVDEDGRETGTEFHTPGSARHGIERQALSESERTAARVAFGVLFDAGRISATELVERVYDEHPAGHGSPDEWADWLTTVFDGVPGIDRESEDGTVWVYDQSVPEQ